jgi:hypothetical protein
MRRATLRDPAIFRDCNSNLGRHCPSLSSRNGHDPALLVTGNRGSAGGVGGKLARIAGCDAAIMPQAGFSTGKRLAFSKIHGKIHLFLELGRFP